MPFAQKYQATQTLLLYRANESFGLRIALGNSRRAKNDLHAAGLEDLPKTLTVFGIAVEDQMRLAQGKAIRGVDELTSHLAHPLSVGRQGRAAHPDGA